MKSGCSTRSPSGVSSWTSSGPPPSWCGPKTSRGRDQIRRWSRVLPCVSVPGIAGTVRSSRPIGRRGVAPGDGLRSDAACLSPHAPLTAHGEAVAPDLGRCDSDHNHLDDTDPPGVPPNPPDPARRKTQATMRTSDVAGNPARCPKTARPARRSGAVGSRRATGAKGATTLVTKPPAAASVASAVAAAHRRRPRHRVRRLGLDLPRHPGRRSRTCPRCRRRRWRYGVAGVHPRPGSWPSGRGWSVLARQPAASWPGAALLGLLLPALGNGLVSVGEQTAPRPASRRSSSPRFRCG